MLPLAPETPTAKTRAHLTSLQSRVDAVGDFPGRVVEGKRLWDRKTGSQDGKSAFQDIRGTLARMCTGPVRCHYCEDSAADEIEHVRPKDLFPGLVFVWGNYLFACGPCNGPKGNRYSFVRDGRVEGFSRPQGAPPTRPPDLPDALIDPRREDPRDFMELDLGGVAPDGSRLNAQLYFEPIPDLPPTETARCIHTIKILGLNRTVLVAARRNAFTGYLARIREYIDRRETGCELVDLEMLRDETLRTPHLTVLAEMIRQSDYLPFMQHALSVAPEIAKWPITPPRA